MRKVIVFVLIGAAVFSAACAGNPSEGKSPSPKVSTAQPSTENSPPVAARPKIVVLGDSLTAGLGLSREQAYPSLLQKRLDESGAVFEVVNGGVSGDTSAKAVNQLEWLAQGDVRVVIVAYGGNDGLRGLPVPELKKNLGEAIDRAKRKGAVVILTGMEAPPNYGPEYVKAFRDAFRELSAEHRIPLVPFLLEGVAGNQSLNQEDGIHPNAAGAKIVADNVWKVLEPVVRKG